MGVSRPHCHVCQDRSSVQLQCETFYAFCVAAIMGSLQCELDAIQRLVPEYLWILLASLCFNFVSEVSQIQLCSQHIIASSPMPMLRSMEVEYAACACSNINEPACPTFVL